MVDTPKPSNPVPPCVGDDEPRIIALYRSESAVALVSSTTRDGQVLQSTRWSTIIGLDTLLLQTLG